MKYPIKKFYIFIWILAFLLSFFTSVYASSSITFGLQGYSIKSKAEYSNETIIQLYPVSVDTLLNLQLHVRFDASDPMINTINKKRIVLLNDSSWVNWQDCIINIGYGLSKNCDLIVNTGLLAFTGIDSLHFIAEVIKDGQIVRRHHLILILPFLPYIEPEPEFTRGDTNIIYWHRSKGMYDQYITINKVPNTMSGNVIESWTDPMITVFKGLQDGREYVYQIKGITKKGKREIFSKIEKSTQDNLPPEACNSLKVWSVGGKTAYLSWSKLNDFGSGVAYYKVYTFQNSDGTIAIDIDSVKNNEDDYYKFSKSINKSQNYFFEVHAVDSVGNEGIGKRSSIVRFIEKPKFCASNVDYKAENLWTYSSLIKTDSGYVKRLKLSADILNADVVPDSFRIEIARDSLKFIEAQYDSGHQYFDYGWQPLSEINKFSDAYLYFNCNLGNDLNWVNNHKYHFKVTYKDRYDNYSDPNILTITRIDIAPPSSIELNHVWMVKDSSGHPFIELSWYKGQDNESGLNRYVYYQKFDGDSVYQKFEFDSSKIIPHLRPSGRQAYYYKIDYDSIASNRLVYYKVGGVDNVGNILKAENIPSSINYEQSIRCYYPPILKVINADSIAPGKYVCDCLKDSLKTFVLKRVADDLSDIEFLQLNINKNGAETERQVSAIQDTVQIPLNILNGLYKIRAAFKYEDLQETGPFSSEISILVNCKPAIDSVKYLGDQGQLSVYWHGPNIWAKSPMKYRISLSQGKNSLDTMNVTIRDMITYGNHFSFGQINPLGANNYYFVKIKAYGWNDSTDWSQADSCEALAPTVCQKIPALRNQDLFVTDLPFNQGVYINWKRYEEENADSLARFNKIVYKITRNNSTWYSANPFICDSTVKAKQGYFYEINPVIVSINEPPDTFSCDGVTTRKIWNYTDLTFIPAIDSAKYDSMQFSTKNNGVYYFKSDTLPIFWAVRHNEQYGREKFYGLDRLIIEASNNSHFEDNIYKNKFVLKDTVYSLQDSTGVPIPKLIINKLHILSGDTLYIRLAGFDPWGNPGIDLWSETFKIVRDAVPPSSIFPKVWFSASPDSVENTLNFDFNWLRPHDIGSGLNKYHIILTRRDTIDNSKRITLIDTTLTIKKFNSACIFNDSQSKQVFYKIDSTKAKGQLFDHFNAMHIKLKKKQSRGFLNFTISSFDALGNQQLFNKNCETPDLFLAPVLRIQYVHSDSFKIYWENIQETLHYYVNIVDDPILLGQYSPNDTLLNDTCYIGAMDRLQGRPYWFVVKSVLPYGETGWSNFVKIVPDSIPPGAEMLAGVYSSEVPKTFKLFPNYPNPFNMQTAISYQLPKKSHVKLCIYNMLGEMIRTVVDKEQPAGYYHIIWDGKDEFGRTVSSGLYFYIFYTQKYIAKGKCLLLK